MDEVVGCIVCGVVGPHLAHSIEDVQEARAAQELSKSRHPSRRKRRSRPILLPVESHQDGPESPGPTSV